MHSRLLLTQHFFVVAAFSVLRARAARKLNSQTGLLADVTPTNCNDCTQNANASESRQQAGKQQISNFDERRVQGALNRSRCCTSIRRLRARLTDAAKSMNDGYATSTSHPKRIEKVVPGPSFDPHTIYMGRNSFKTKSLVKCYCS